jgi:hypothetical protein
MLFLENRHETNIMFVRNEHHPKFACGRGCAPDSTFDDLHEAQQASSQLERKLVRIPAPPLNACVIREQFVPKLQST